MHSKAPKQKESRLSNLRENNPDSTLLQMPSLSGCSYLIDYLIEIGTSMASGFGVTPLTWSEVESWSNLTEIRISSWEATMLINLSRTFTSSFNKFDDKEFPSPYVVEDFDREKVSQNIGSLLRSLASRVNKNG